MAAVSINKKHALSEMSAVLAVEPECSTCGQKELDAKPPRRRLGCIKAAAPTTRRAEAQRQRGGEVGRRSLA